MKKEVEVYNKVKDFAIAELISPKTYKEFKDFIFELKKLLDENYNGHNTNNNLTGYSLVSDDVTISVYISDYLLSVDYTNIIDNISFQVEKFK